MNADIHKIFSSGECPPHEELLAYFRGELTGEEKNRIEHHLMECEMCSDELGGLSKMKDVEKLPLIVAEIRSEIASKQKKVIRMSPRILLTAAAATVVLLIGALFLFRFNPSHDQEKVLAQQNKGPVSAEMQAPLPPAAVKQVPSPPSASSGKPLLAVVQHPEKKETVKEEEKIVPVTADEVTAMQEPKAELPPDENKVILVQPRDSMTQQKALGYVSGVEVVNENGKMATRQPSPLAEEKKDRKGIVVQRVGTGNDKAMSLYREEDYLQASLLFEQKLAADTSNSGIRYYLADCWFHLKEYLKAKQILQKIVADPNDAYYQRAVDLLKKVKGEE